MSVTERRNADLAEKRAQMLFAIARNVLVVAVLYTLVTALAFGWYGMGIAWLALGGVLIGAGGMAFAAYAAGWFLRRNLHQDHPPLGSVIAQSIACFLAGAGAVASVVLIGVALVGGLGATLDAVFTVALFAGLCGVFGWFVGGLTLSDPL